MMNRLEADKAGRNAGAMLNRAGTILERLYAPKAEQ
jgi:hypothetical protein